MDQFEYNTLDYGRNLVLASDSDMRIERSSISIELQKDRVMGVLDFSGVKYAFWGQRDLQIEAKLPEPNRLQPIKFKKISINSYGLHYAIAIGGKLYRRKGPNLKWEPIAGDYFWQFISVSDDGLVIGGLKTDGADVPFVGSSPNNKCQLRKIEEDTLEIIDANSSDLSVGSKDFLYGLNYENEAWSSSYAHLKNATGTPRGNNLFRWLDNKFFLTSNKFMLQIHTNKDYRVVGHTCNDGNKLYIAVQQYYLDMNQTPVNQNRNI